MMEQIQNGQYEKNQDNEVKGFRLILRALKYRNFRIFFIGQTISLLGTWMQTIAMSWLVFRLTDSVFLLGLVGFSSQISTFLLSPFAGVLIDRWNRHRVVIITQTLSMIQAFLLAFLTLTNRIAVWQIISLSVFIGLINSFDIPARQAFLIDMIEREDDLGNAIALNSSMFNAARLLGPTVAGITIAAVGEGVCFLFNAVSYLAVIVALFAMRINSNKTENVKVVLRQELHEGFRYVFGFPPIWAILLLLALVSFMGMPYAVLMPIFATKILHGGAETLGFLVGASGVGALTGALYLASRKSVLGLEKMMVIASGIFGIGLIAFSLSHFFSLSLFILFFIGFGLMVHMASSNTVLQTIVDEDKRGRLMSFYTMAFAGMEPFGSLLGGSLASIIGAPKTLFMGGVCCLLGSLIFARKLSSLRAMVHPIYRKKGIIQETA